MSTTIGFIGLGIMGKPMARNLMKAGYQLVVYNRSPGPMNELTAEGATAASNPREVAEQSNVVITMLPDSPQVQEVMTGENGVLAGAKANALVIDMSTISPVVTQQLARAAQARGVRMLDAPVSGGDVGAQQGTLSIMVGGNFLQHNFQPGFKIALHEKDLGIALAAGREYGVPLLVTAIVDQMLQALKLRGKGEQDHSALLTLIEDWAQHRIGESK